MIKKTTETNILELTYCDICETRSYKRCRMCDRDICHEHSNGIDYNEWGSNWDTYQYYCPNCYGIVLKYLRECEKINNRYEKDIVEIMIKCKKECLEKVDMKKEE
jgi:hypothetical protein